MTTVQVDGIGKVVVRPAGAGLQLALQLLAWPFFCVGGIGLAVTLRAYSQDRDVPARWDPDFILLGLGVSGSLLGIGALLRWSASKYRMSRFLVGDWYIYMLNGIAKDRHPAASEAAAALVTKAAATVADAKMIAKAHLYLGFYGERPEHWEAAMPLLDRIIAAEPTHSAFRLDRAQALQKTSRHEEALRELDAMNALELAERSRALSVRVSSLTARGRFEDALGTCGTLEALAKDLPNKDDLRAAAEEHRKEVLAAKARCEASSESPAAQQGAAAAAPPPSR